MSHQDFVRQADLVPLDRLQAEKITVIGLGAIGRQVALQLAAIGARHLQFIDHDHVDRTNVVTQGYFATDVGQLKTKATSITVALTNPGIQIESIADRFRARHQVGQVVFACVDSIAARAAIWRSVHGRIALWIDGRMLGEVLRVLAACSSHGSDQYAASLFAPHEAQTGRCTARTTIYAASIAAGMMVHQFSRWLRDLPVDRDTTLNLLSGELTVA